MLILILFLLLPIPEQNSKVVISAGVPGAEIYLDGNLVYTTDKSGTVPMELPSGSFNLMIKKQGYKPYSGSFTIRAGESKLLRPVLEKIRAPRKTDIAATAASRGGKSPGNQSGVAPAKTNAKPIPTPIPPAGVKPDKESPMPIPQEESQESSVLPVVVLLGVVALLTLGFLTWKRKGDFAEIQPPDAAAETVNPEPQDNVPSRPEPPFIEELKRREELLKAGFVTSPSRAAHNDTAKEKEVIIVLPKEAFRYEEDK
jgi:hypothetical protein